MSATTKKARILSHLKRGWAITPAIAFSKYGCLSLSQRIGDLIEEGYDIHKDWLETESGSRVRRYRLAR